MKKLLLLLMALLLPAFGMLAVEKSYTIVFAHGADNTQTNWSTTSAMNDIATSGADYLMKVTSVTSTQSAASPGQYGLKLGSNAGAGFIEFSLSEKAQVKPSKIVVKVSANKGASSQKLAVNGKYANSSLATTNTNASYADLEFNGFDNVITTLKLEKEKVSTQGFLYVESVSVYYNDGGSENPDPDPVTPSLPVVSYNGQIVNNEDDVEVAKGTVLNISSDNATSITIDVDGGDVATINGAAGTFTVNEDCYLTITGHNGTLSSDEFVAMFTIKEEQNPDPTPVQGNTYKLVTSTADLVDGGKYVIAAGKKAMSNAAFSSNAAAAVDVEISTDNVLTATDNVMVFTLKKSGTSWLWNFDNYKATGTGLASGSGTDLGVNAADASVSIVGGNVEIIFSKTTTRLVMYNGSVFKNYASSNKGSGSYVVPKLYKLVENEAPVEKDYVFPQKDLVSLFVDDTFQINLGEEHPELAFAPVNAEIVSVSADGLLKGLAVGETVVNVSWDAANGWTAGQAIFNVKVRPQLVDPEISFRHAEIRGKLGVGVAAQAAYHKSNGKITYSSSNEAVVKVNPNTGMITPANVFAVGEAVITASIEETETYRAGTATYKVVIENPSVVPVVDDGPVMFDFRIEGCYNFKTNSYSGTDTKYEIDFDDPVMSISESVVTMAFDPESQFRSFNGSSDVKQLRIYGGAKFSFEVPEGYAIAKIVFNQISVKSGCNIIEDVVDGAIALGTINQKDADQDDDTNVKTWREWIANDGVVASKVNFTMANTSGHARIRTISVVIKKSDSTRQLPELSFATRVYNTYVDTETLVNAATKRTEEDVDIFYSIDNLTDNDYTIFAEDDGNLKVLVDIPGVYTLRAKSNPTENLLAGVAILRLNVFPRLGVVPGDDHLQHHDDAVVLPEDGGKVNFSEVPTTLQVLVDRNDGNDFLAHDWNDINVTEDSHFTYCMEYAETYRTEPSDLHVFLMPKQPAYEKNGQLLTLLSQANTQLYVYAYVHDYAPAQNARRVAATGEDQWVAVGSNLHELTIPDLGATELYIVNAKAVKATGHDKVGDLESQVVTVGYDNDGNLSGIGSVVADGAAGEVFFNLQGVRVQVQGELAPGVYIRRQGSQATKVVIR